MGKRDLQEKDPGARGLIPVRCQAVLLCPVIFEICALDREACVCAYIHIYIYMQTRTYIYIYT